MLNLFVGSVSVKRNRFIFFILKQIILEAMSKVIGHMRRRIRIILGIILGLLVTCMRWGISTKKV